MTRSPREHLSGGEDDGQLFSRLRAGDPEALGILFERYDSVLAVYANRFLHSQDRANDIVQDVFVRLWEERSRLNIRGSGKAYLYAAVRNRALDAIKHDRMEHRWQEAFIGGGFSPSMGTPSREGDEALEMGELEAAIRIAISQLPERARQIATLRWYDKLSRAEIAEIMGITVGTVNKQLTLAARAMREKLQAFRP
jgi:RNA polymerase sigma-70 factor (ECF subfamily)